MRRYTVRRALHRHRDVRDDFLENYATIQDITKDQSQWTVHRRGKTSCLPGRQPGQQVCTSYAEKPSRIYVNVKASRVSAVICEKTHASPHYDIGASSSYAPKSECLRRTSLSLSAVLCLVSAVVSFRDPSAESLPCVFKPSL